MQYRFVSFFLLYVLVLTGGLMVSLLPASVMSYTAPSKDTVASSTEAEPIAVIPHTEATALPVEPLSRETDTTLPYDVPFYSQFTDISDPDWQKVGCGIASLAMLIDYYRDESPSVESLLEAGISAGAYIDSAGWSHAGLIGLAEGFDLTGATESLAHVSMNTAFETLKTELEEAGPVMVSVHYTFEPTNPIPHLAVITGVDDEHVYYNDPADRSGGKSISIEQFQSAWKKRYIAIRPL